MSPFDCIYYPFFYFLFSRCLLMSFINFSKIQFICVSIMIIVFCVLFKKFFLTQGHEDFLLEAPLFYIFI